MPKAQLYETATLICFGDLRLDGAPKAKVTSKHLLLLSYVLLEGVTSRQNLASLFWPHLADEVTRKGERKDMSNLGVARAVIRRNLDIDIENKAQLGALNCDVQAFRTALRYGKLEEALDYYRQGSFLQDIENKPRLGLSHEFYFWLDQKRAELSNLAQDALTRLAQDPQTQQTVLSYAEETFKLSRHSRDLAMHGQLYQLLTRLSSPLMYEARKTFSTLADEYLEAELSEEALRFYLMLSLQSTLNLAAAQVAADLSPHAAAACLEELRDCRLITTDNTVLSQELAHYYFEKHPQQKLSLLGSLRDNSPPEQAYSIYQNIYEITQTFGGMGYWEKARTAYCAAARAHMDNQDFQSAAEVLQQFQEAEYRNQQRPNPENRFLQAYALERLRHYTEGLQVLENVQETPEILAIKAALLVRTANYQTARALAEQVERIQLETLESGQKQAIWAKAIALNTLGQIAYEENSLLEAEVCFDQATIQWALAAQPQRELGALMNRANVLEQLERVEEARRVYEEVLDKCEGDSILRISTLLNLGYMYENLEDWQEAYEFYEQARRTAEEEPTVQRDLDLVAGIYNNLGNAQRRLGFEDARASLKRAVDLSLRAGARLWYAKSLSNLAMLDQDIGKFTVALDLFRQLGSQRELEHYGHHFRTMLRDHIVRARSARNTENLLFLMKTFSAHHPFQSKALEQQADKLIEVLQEPAVDPNDFTTIDAALEPFLNSAKAASQS